MYCSSCGGAVAPGLTYCKHCGTRLNEAKGVDQTKSTDLPPKALVWGIVAIFVFGIGSIIALMTIMKGLNFNEGLINGFIMVAFLLMLIIEGAFIWLLLSRTRGAKEAGDMTRLKEQTTKELDAAQALSLPEPLPSVTEHTTRTLEPTLSDRRSD